MRVLTIGGRMLGAGLHARGDAFTIALVMPQHGAAAMYFPSGQAAADLAVAEVNAHAGVGGRELNVRLVDACDSDERYLLELAGDARRGRIDAITGAHSSLIKDSVSHAVGGHVPYLFPSVWEGGPRGFGMLCTGETPRQQVWPALQWMTAHAGVSRWFIVGDDYVWPQKTARFVVERLRARNTIAGVSLVSYEKLEREEHQDSVMAELLTQLERSGADGVLMLFVGSHAALFNRAFAERGLDSSILRFSPLMDENMLLASGPDATRGLLSATSYINGSLTPDGMQFQAAYARHHGPQAPTLNLLAVSIYDSIRMIAQLVDAIDGRPFTPERLERAVSDGFSYAGPRGELLVTAGDVTQDIHLVVADGCDFVPVDRLSA